MKIKKKHVHQELKKLKNAPLGYALVTKNNMEKSTIGKIKIIQSKFHQTHEFKLNTPFKPISKILLK